MNNQAEVARQFKTNKSFLYTYLTSGPFLPSLTLPEEGKVDGGRKSARRIVDANSNKFGLFSSFAPVPHLRCVTHTHAHAHTRPRRRDVTDQCCRGVARPFAAVGVAGGSRALGYVRPRSGLLARSYGEERQLLFDTRAEESVRYLAVGDIRRVPVTECRVSRLRCFTPALPLWRVVRGQVPYVRYRDRLVVRCEVGRGKPASISARARER